MGIEHKWGQYLCDVMLGKKIDFNGSGKKQGTSPNQRTQYAALCLAVGLETGNKRLIDSGIELCSDLFIRQQKHGHMCLGSFNDAKPNLNNEMLIAGAHYNIWALGMAAILRYCYDFQSDYRIESLKEDAQQWWDEEFKIYGLFATPDGAIICPSSRWVAVDGQSPCYQRDSLYRAYKKLPLIGDAKRSKWWKLTDPQQAGITWMREMIERVEYVPIAPIVLNFADEIRIYRNESMHYAWAPNGIRSMKPVNYAYVNYADGSIEYREMETNDWNPDEETVIPGIEP